MSKGSKRRPAAVSDEQVTQRWAAIFQAQEAQREVNEARAANPPDEEEPEEGWPDGLPAFRKQGST